MRVPLLQLRILRLGFLQDGNVGVGLTPKLEEIVICATGFYRITAAGEGAGKAQPGQSRERRIQHHAGVVDELLEFYGGFGSITRRKIGIAADVSRVNGCDGQRRRAGKVQRGGGVQIGNRFRRLPLVKVNLRANDGEPVSLDKSALRPLLIEFVTECFRLLQVANLGGRERRQRCLLYTSRCV